MLNEFKCSDQHKWDEGKIIECCPDPPPQPDPPSSDCCYNTWQCELNGVNWELQQVTWELTHVQKHLDVLTLRGTRLQTWHTELSTANDLAKKICCQLELIEAQIGNICKNTHFTVKAIEILYCMLKEFYVVVDCLQQKYDCLVNCIKCLNNPKLTLTQGIGKALSDYAAALAAVLQTKDALIPLVMSVIDAAIKLHKEICDHYGYKKLIKQWMETLHCGVPCGDEHKHEGYGGEEPYQQGSAEGIPPEDIFCLTPIISFPICNDPYYKNIKEWLEQDKEDARELTKQRNELAKKQLALQACQQSLTNALKEVNPSLRCS